MAMQSITQTNHKRMENHNTLTSLCCPFSYVSMLILDNNK